MTTQTHTCIYCRRELPDRDFKREHVLPQLLGTFEDNLVLHQEVCKECNSHFSAHIERVLAYGSGEAVRRLQHGVKPADKASELWHDRLVMTWEIPGEWNGAVMKLDSEDGAPVIVPVLQVGFRRLTVTGRAYVTAEHLADLSKELPDDIDTKTKVMLVFDSDEGKQRLLELLAARDISIKPTEDEAAPLVGGEEIRVSVDGRIDVPILRCAAKIALNYVAYVHGAEFTLRPDFDEVRSFVRYGDFPERSMITVDREPILGDETRHWRHCRSHLVTLGWSPDRRHIVGQVALFNDLRYVVALAPYFSGIWREIKSGHCFDIDLRRVRPMIGVHRVLRT